MKRPFLCAVPEREAGLTLVELMISITLGLIIVMAATALLLSSKSGYIQQDESARMDDAGRYAIESIARAVRQAAYVNWDSSEAPVVATDAVSPNIRGLDANSLNAAANGLTSPLNRSINGSDVLAIRFFGAGTGTHGDGTMVNCAGFGVPAPANAAAAENARGWSIFYVAQESSGEHSLYCKYRGENGWAVAAIAHGVDSFQVLYGVDTDGDGLPNQVLNAAGVDALDAAPPPSGGGGGSAGSHWKKVVTVKVALLLRGTNGARTDTTNAVYDLFGEDYSDAHASDDRGVRVDERNLPQALRNKPRRIYVSTIQLRNESSGSGV